MIILYLFATYLIMGALMSLGNPENKGAKVYEFPIDLTESEKELVRPFFSNVNRHIFALTNLPEVVMGTLFSRYSRSDKTIRRLLLDEFLPNKDIFAAIRDATPVQGPTDAIDIKRAENFYERILVGYGDDSVAELAGAHVACEFVSSMAGDMLTDSRIGLSPLEKSARYVLFDKKVNGKYLWYRNKRIMGSKFAESYEQMMDELFDNYVKWLPQVTSYVKEVTPRAEDTTERAYENATKAKACDILKNMLPASRLTNVGLFGNGRAYEYLLSKLYSSELPEAVEIATAMHGELEKVLPAFVRGPNLRTT